MTIAGQQVLLPTVIKLPGKVVEVRNLQGSSPGMDVGACGNRASGLPVDCHSLSQCIVCDLQGRSIERLISLLYHSTYDTKLKCQTLHPVVLSVSIIKISF